MRNRGGAARAKRCSSAPAKRCSNARANRQRDAMQRIAAIAALAALGFAGRAAALPFENVASGGRSAAMGDMQATLSLGSEAVLGNPALLGEVKSLSVNAMTRDWYGSGMRSYAVSVAQPLGDLGLGLAWHRFGQSDLWTEDLIALGGAWTYQLPTGTMRINLGGSLKAMQVAAPGYRGSDYQGDFTTWSGDLAAMIEPMPFLRAAWTGENLAAGKMTLLDGGERHRSAPRRQRLGLSLRWGEDLLLAAEYVKREERDGKLHLGGELGFYQAFTVRAGAGEGFATAGFGVDGGRWQADAAFESRGQLGTSLVFSIRLQPGKPAGRKP